MAQYPNVRYATCNPARYFGAAPGLDVYSRNLGSRMNVHMRETADPTASKPFGYGMQAMIPPRVAGGMSTAARGFLTFSEGASAAIAARTLTAAATFVVLFEEPEGSLSLQVTLSGTGAITFSGTSPLVTTSSLSGTWASTFSGAGALSMIVPIAGVGSWALTGASTDLRGFLSLEGEWTPFTTLSPENLAAAVWNSVATDYIDAGTMGEVMNQTTPYFVWRRTA